MAQCYIWNITNVAEPSATDKNNIYTFATGVGMGMKWI